MEHYPNDVLPIPKAKRVFDIVVSGLALIILSPLFLLISLLIKIEGFFVKISQGPIFYIETRVSQGQPFTFRKFRIFKVSAYEPLRANGQIVHTKPLERNGDNLTETGKILKKFYLDELPQFWNVFVGGMSLVGPRPWNPVDYENDVKAGNFRKKVLKAGLTGLVQISKGRNGDHKNGTDLDEKYIELVKNLSPLKLLLLDLWIMGRSIRLILRGEGL